MDGLVGWCAGGLAVLAGCSLGVPVGEGGAVPLVAEWPAEKVVYVADGKRLRAFRIGLGLAPLAERPLPAGRLERLEADPASGRLTLVMAAGRVEVDGRSLR